MLDECTKLDVRMFCLELAGKLEGVPKNPRAVLEAARELEAWVEDGRSAGQSVAGRAPRN